MTACLHNWNACAAQSMVRPPEGHRHECQYCRKCHQGRCIETDEEGAIVHVWDRPQPTDVDPKEVTG